MPENAAVIACGDFGAAVVLPRVTVAEAFQRTLESLLKARNLTQTQLAEMAGLDISTVSRLIGGTRVERFDSIEKIRVAFRLQPADLFDEERALAQIGLIRRETDTSGQPLDSRRTPGVGSPRPAQLKGVDVLGHGDPELLSALLSYWDAIPTDARLELVGHGNRLRKSSEAVALKNA